MAQAERQRRAPILGRRRFLALAGAGTLAIGVELMRIAINAIPEELPEPTPSGFGTDDIASPQDSNTLLRSTILDCSTANNGKPLVAFAEWQIGTPLRKTPDIESPEIRPPLPAKEPVIVKKVMQRDFQEGTEFWGQDPVEVSAERRVPRGTKPKYAFMATQQGDKPMQHEMTFDEMVLIRCVPVSEK